MTTPTPPATVDTADLAVVVVHGIGSQDVGSTLIAWAEPILQELRKYVEDRGGTLRYGPAQLHSDPAEVNVRFDLGDQSEKTWTFLEARWAAAFPWPGSREVLRWAGKFTHRVADRYWRQLTRPIRVYRADLNARVAIPGLSIRDRAILLAAKIVARVYTVIWYVVCLCACALAMLGGWFLALSLLVLGAIPYVRGKIAKVTTQLVASVGDAYLFTSRPLHSAAMVEAIRSCVERARGSAKHVCVLAHSQGSALAIRTLLCDDGCAADMLITVGAAVDLLDEHAKPVRSWLQKTPNMRWINIWTPWDPVPSGPIADSPEDERLRYEAAASTTDVLASLIKGARVRNNLSPRALSASATLVPGPEEWPVHNRCSLIRDHTAYAQNIPQVIRPITERLVALTEGRAAALPAVDEGHVRRVRYLGVSRLAAALCAVGVVLHLVVRQLLAKGPGERGVPPLVETFIDWLKARYHLPLPRMVGSVTTGADLVLCISFVGLLVFLVSYSLVKVWWFMWNRRGEVLSIEESNESARPFEWAYFNYQKLNRTFRGRADDGRRWWSQAFFRMTLWLLVIGVLHLVWEVSLLLLFWMLLLGDVVPIEETVIVVFFFSILLVMSALAVFHLIVWPKGGIRLYAIPEAGNDSVPPTCVSAPLAQPDTRRNLRHSLTKRRAALILLLLLLWAIALQNNGETWRLSPFPATATTIELSGVMRLFLYSQLVLLAMSARLGALERFGRPLIKWVRAPLVIGCGGLSWLLVLSNWESVSINVLMWRMTLPASIALAAIAIVVHVATYYSWTTRDSSSARRLCRPAIRARMRTPRDEHRPPDDGHSRAVAVADGWRHEAGESPRCELADASATDVEQPRCSDKEGDARNRNTVTVNAKG